MRNTKIREKLNYHRDLIATIQTKRLNSLVTSWGWKAVTQKYSWRETSTAPDPEEDPKRNGLMISRTSAWKRTSKQYQLQVTWHWTEKFGGAQLLESHLREIPQEDGCRSGQVLVLLCFYGYKTSVLVIRFSVSLYQAWIIIRLKLSPSPDSPLDYMYLSLRFPNSDIVVVHRRCFCND